MVIRFTWRQQGCRRWEDGRVKMMVRTEEGVTEVLASHVIVAFVRQILY